MELYFILQSLYNKPIKLQRLLDQLYKNEWHQLNNIFYLLIINQKDIYFLQLLLVNIKRSYCKEGTKDKIYTSRKQSV